MHYYSVLVDVSSDASYNEKEVIFSLYVEPSTGKPKLCFFSLKKVDQATASAILVTIKQSFEDHTMITLLAMVQMEHLLIWVPRVGLQL